jgi:hypothetical protein
MQKIRQIFFLAVVALFSFSLIVKEETEEVCPYEEVIEEAEAGFFTLFKEAEEEGVLLKNSRRTKNNQQESVAEKSFYQFYQKTDLSSDFKQEKSAYKSDYKLCQNEEIRFLHRFQLF